MRRVVAAVAKEESPPTAKGVAELVGLGVCDNGVVGGATAGHMTLIPLTMLDTE
jgi:hypothetical protein